VVTGGLNVDSGLHHKRVCVVAFNLRGFREVHSTKGGTSSLIAAQERQLVIITKHVRANKGFVDYFQGDHILCSFNAVNNVNGSAMRGATTMLSSLAELEADPIVPHASAAMACGTALVGNIGTSDMRRFMIIGEVMAMVTQLERLTKFYTCSNLVTSQVLTEIETYFSGSIVDRVPLGKQRDGAFTSRLIATLREREKGSGTEEWMYDLAASEKNDPNRVVNNAFVEFAEGRTVEAQTLLNSASVSDLVEGTPAANGAINLKSLINAEKPHRDMGLYFGLQ
jgi:class 3 adenylate cyclase